MSISRYKIGDSFAADQIRFLFSGAPSHLLESLHLAVVQICADESYNSDGWFVLAGYFAHADQWIEFAKEWELLVDKIGRVHTDGQKYFHFADIINSEHALEWLKYAQNIIEDHALKAISIAFKPEWIDAAQCRVYCPDYNLRLLKPEKVMYQISWNQFISVVLEKLGSNLPSDVEFIFDDCPKANNFLNAWSNANGHLGEYFPNRPIFRDDKRFLPLQAADFLAGKTRVMLKDQQNDQSWVVCDKLRENQNIDTENFIIDESILLHMIIESTVRTIPKGSFLIDKVTRRGVEGLC